MLAEVEHLLSRLEDEKDALAFYPAQIRSDLGRWHLLAYIFRRRMGETPPRWAWEINALMRFPEVWETMLRAIQDQLRRAIGWPSEQAVLEEVAKHCNVKCKSPWAKDRGLPWDKARLVEELQFFHDRLQQDYVTQSDIYARALLGHLLRSGPPPEWAIGIAKSKWTTGSVKEAVARMLTLL